MSTPFLQVQDLKVHFPTEDGLVKAVDGLSFEVEAGRTLGIVGESGSGKSVTSLAILGLQKGTRAQVSGRILVNGDDVVAMDEEAVRKMRGTAMAMIFQDSLAALHPFYKVGWQIAEAYKQHNKVSKKAAWERAVEMLDLVGIPEPRKRASDYPHQFSGGMRQRAMIAMALSCNPKLLIADEPTTALDVTVQAQILDLLRDLQREFGSAIIMITHDLGVVSEIADDVLVMYGGRAVEYGSTRTVLDRAGHPYTWGLLESLPRLAGDPNVRLQTIAGSPPSLIAVPSGCAFNPRCPYAGLLEGRCSSVVPTLEALQNDPTHLVRCHLTPEHRDRVFRTEIAPQLQ